MEMEKSSFLPEDFNLEEWKLFKKYNNREEKQSRHIDAWAIDEPNLPEEEKQRRLAYNKEHLIKDTLEQLSKGLLVEENNALLQTCDECQDIPKQVKPEPVLQEVSTNGAETSYNTEKAPEKTTVIDVTELLDLKKPETVKPVVEEPIPVPNQEQTNDTAPLTNLMEDMNKKLDKLINLMEALVEKEPKSKSKGRNKSKEQG